jgi:hypothetical protein
MMAVMLGPADKKAREKYIVEIPGTIRLILDMMDKLK